MTAGAVPRRTSSTSRVKTGESSVSLPLLVLVTRPMTTFFARDATASNAGQRFD